MIYALVFVGISVVVYALLTHQQDQKLNNILTERNAIDSKRNEIESKKLLIQTAAHQQTVQRWNEVKEQKRIGDFKPKKLSDMKKPEQATISVTPLVKPPLPPPVPESTANH